MNNRDAEINIQEELIKTFYIEVWGKGNLDFADEVFHSDYIRHDLRQGKSVPGPEGQKQIARDFRSSFPDLKISVDLVFSNGQYTTGKWTMSGIHSGKWGSIEPTNKKAKFSGVNIFRFEDGKVKEIWNYRDDFGLMQQLGTIVYAGSIK